MWLAWGITLRENKGKFSVPVPKSTWNFIYFSLEVENILIISTKCTYYKY